MDVKIQLNLKKEKSMKKFVVVAALLMVAGCLMAQNTNTVTVNVNYITAQAVTGDVDFTLTDDGSGGYTVTPGSNTASLTFRHNGSSGKKVTGVAAVTTPGSVVAGYDITVVASAITGGTSGGSQTLVDDGAVTTAKDLITAISRVGNGAATLTFGLTGATLSNTGVSSDANSTIVYTVTYTLTN